MTGKGKCAKAPGNRDIETPSTGQFMNKIGL
jgi:hypothetical protein